MQITLLDSILVEIFQDIRMHTIGILQGFQKYRNDNRKATTNKLENTPLLGIWRLPCHLWPFHTNIYAYLCKKETEQLCDPTTEHIYLDPKIWQLILKWYNMMGSYPINYIYKHYCSLWWTTFLPKAKTDSNLTCYSILKMLQNSWFANYIFNYK